MTRPTSRMISCLAAALFASGCSTLFNASISVRRPEGTAPFTDPERETAKAIVVGICRSAGFRETDTARRLEENRLTSPYHHFVSLGGEDFEQDTVDVLGLIREDRREILVSIGDDYRGDPLPSTEKLIEDVRAALERAFPDSRVVVERHEKRRTFAP